MGARDEWLRHNEQIPTPAYDEMYFTRFDPDLFDPDAWAFRLLQTILSHPRANRTSHGRKVGAASRKDLAAPTLLTARAYR
jgi:hypothetical protein